MKTLILPVAGQSSRFPNMRPKWLLTMPDGLLMVEKSVSRMNLKNFSRIIIVCLKKHILKYVDKKKLIKNFKKNISNKIEILEINKPTSCQAETILLAIKQAKIRGGIYIKDCDNMFAANIDSIPKNDVTIVDSNTVGLIDAKSKSYVNINKLGYITNIIEKEVISSFFCCGGYSFESAKDFTVFSTKLLKKSKDVFISHVIFSMILNNKMFTHTSANKYIDWGTLREFRNWQKNYTTIFCDLDGCLFKNGSKFGELGWKTKVIKKNIDLLFQMKKTGFLKLIITTSRPKSEINHIKKEFLKYKIKPDYILTDLFHSKRILVNDFSETNSFPTAIAVNLERDSEELASIFKSLIN